MYQRKVPVPTSYSECLKNPRSKYDKLSCSMDYLVGINNSKVKECLNLGGCNPAAADGADGCVIGFINLDFVFPTSFEECKEMGNIQNSGSININEERCWFLVNSACSGNIEEATNKIIGECPEGFEIFKGRKDANGKYFATCEKFFYK